MFFIPRDQVASLGPQRRQFADAVRRSRSISVDAGYGTGAHVVRRIARAALDGRPTVIVPFSVAIASSSIGAEKYRANA